MKEDLISRILTVDRIQNMSIENCTDVEDIIDKACSIVANMPAAGASRVAHGRWRTCGLGSKECMCSACGNIELYLYRYCPMCGTKMDGGNTP